MKILLDTCTALWLFQGSPRLSERVRLAVADPGTELLFHQVSYLEITLKHAKGSVKLTTPPAQLLPKALHAYRIGYVGLDNREIAALETLPPHHADPFDRLLIAAALRHCAILATPDPQIQRYDLPVMW